MGYDRSYGREEIHQMMYDSERRLRPSAPVDRAHKGHAISQHTEQRENLFDRRHIRQDSVFTGRKDLILAAEEALHTPEGQLQLARLNAHEIKTCKIAVKLETMKTKVTATVVVNPATARVDGKKVITSGPALYLEKLPVDSVVLILDKLRPAQSWAPLHFQTAYPGAVDFSS